MVYCRSSCLDVLAVKFTSVKECLVNVEKVTEEASAQARLHAVTPSCYIIDSSDEVSVSGILA